MTKIPPTPPANERTTLVPPPFLARRYSFSSRGAHRHHHHHFPPTRLACLSQLPRLSPTGDCADVEPTPPPRRDSSCPVALVPSLKDSK
jgi:hypothetical protein